MSPIIQKEKKRKNPLFLAIKLSVYETMNGVCASVYGFVRYLYLMLKIIKLYFLLSSDTPQRKENEIFVTDSLVIK